MDRHATESSWTVSSKHEIATTIFGDRPFFILSDNQQGGATRMSKGNFSTTKQERCLEDFVEGAIREFGPITITEDEIVRFGKRFDPQLFHTDPEGAKGTIYGGLIASGWHTCSLFMRLFVEHYLPGPASLGSPGVDELRWLNPVRPGDELTLRITVHKVKPSRSKLDRGVLFSFCELLNQEGEVVMTMMALNLIRYRDKRKKDGE